MSKLSVNDIPLTDPYVYEFIGTGKTSGIFQVESQGMQNLMKQMFSDVGPKIRVIEKKYLCKGYNSKTLKYYGKETNKDSVAVVKKDFISELNVLGKELFERIIAAISLYRPGPMDYIPNYIEGMLDPSSIKYDTPELAEILKGTYGVIVYQEQVQQIVRKLAGYSLGRGDLIRRAMGKKKTSIMNAEKKVFLYGNESDHKVGEAIVPGCINNGISEEAAIIIWDKMSEFAKYAFNKSHSAGYAVITVQTAWLKFYYPLDFMVGTINSVITKSDKLTFYISQAQELGIKVLGPDINKSEGFYTIEGDSIRTGLLGLRNLGKMAAPVLDERKKYGTYKNIEDFIDRLVSQINKKVLESLIYSGALDCFNGNRHSKIESVPDILDFINFVKKGFFPDVSFDLPEVDAIYRDLKKVSIKELPEYEKAFLLDKEYEFAGMFISGHPLDIYEDVLKLNNVYTIGTILPEEAELEDFGEEVEEAVSPFAGEKVQIAGIIRDKKQIVTKTGKKMYMFSIEDKTGTVKCVMFPKYVSYYEHLIADKGLVLVTGRFEENERGCQVIVESLKEMTDLSLSTINTVWIDGRDKDLNPLKDFIRSHKGNVSVKVQVGKNSVFSSTDKLDLSWTNYMKLKELYNIKLR